MSIKTAKERRAAFEKTTAQELKKFKDEIEVLEFLEQENIELPRSIYIGGYPPAPIECGRLSYGEFREIMTPQKVVEIAEKLPPLPPAYAECSARYKYQVPLKCEDDLNQMIEKKHDELTIFHEVLPVWFTVDGFNVKVHWFTEINNKNYTVNCELSSASCWGRLALTGRITHNQYGRQIKDRDINYEGRPLNCIDVRNIAGEWAGQSFHLQYSAGSDEAWHSVKVWFHMAGGNESCTVADILRAVYEGQPE